MGNLCCCVVIPHSTRGLVDSCSMPEPRVLTPGVHCVCWPRGEGLVGSVSCLPQFVDVCSEARTQDGIEALFKTTIEFRVRTCPISRVNSAFAKRELLEEKLKLETQRAIRERVGNMAFRNIRVEDLEPRILNHLNKALAATNTLDTTDNSWGYNVLACGTEFWRRN